MKIDDLYNQRAWRDLSEKQSHGHQHQDSFAIFQPCIKHCSAFKSLRKPKPFVVRLMII